MAYTFVWEENNGEVRLIIKENNKIVTTSPNIKGSKGDTGARGPKGTAGVSEARVLELIDIELGGIERGSY